VSRSQSKKIDSATRELEKDKNSNELEKKDDSINPIPEEPKRPRYFPPRRLPNPFESAAQEQEKFL
jgi:hypothetical protein